MALSRLIRIVTPTTTASSGKPEVSKSRMLRYWRSASSSPRRPVVAVASKVPPLAESSLLSSTQPSRPPAERNLASRIGGVSLVVKSHWAPPSASVVPNPLWARICQKNVVP